MAKKKRLPDYATIIGEGTEVAGEVRFSGGIHIDGTVIGDVRGQTEDGCALTLGQSGTIRGNLDVAHVVIDGVVVGDVRAVQRAELASAARIEGTLYYGALEMAEGAKVNGKLLAIDDAQAPRLEPRAAEQEQAGDVPPAEISTESPSGVGRAPEMAPLPGDGNT